MTTPIYDFLYRYKKSGISRFHMPGHKGVGFLGIERLDLTEIDGADVLYSPSGIIAESEANATELFGTEHTYYSTEGSTLAIKAMLALVRQKNGEGATVLAARNVHKAFVFAVGQLDLRVEWLYPRESRHLCSCQITAVDVRSAIEAMAERPAAVYLTSPDYLGGMLDIKAIAEVCKEYGIPLLVDNAHGAYLKFLEPSSHPIDLGATMCADSAHKTLPGVLTGGAYLHIAKGNKEYTEGARDALSMFASTSPSYLTLASLDLCNYVLCPDIDDGRTPYPEMLEKCKQNVAFIKDMLEDEECIEPLKIRIDARRFLNTGWGVCEILRRNQIEPEFTDEDFVVLMASPSNTPRDFRRLKSAVRDIIEKRDGAKSGKNATQGRTCDEDAGADSGSITPPRPARAMSIKSALLSPSESIPIDRAEGRILASPTVSCPPAIPIVVSGEVIDKDSIELFKKYNITTVSVVRK